MASEKHSDGTDSSSSSVKLPVKISVVEGLPLVWSMETVKLLRRYQVTGVMDGALPEQPHQNRTRGLPMMLLREAATHLQEIGVIELVEYPDLKHSPTDKMDILQLALERGDFSKQRNRYIEDRKIQIMKHADKILASAKKKNAKLPKDDPKRVPETELTVEKLISDKVKNIPFPKRGSLVVQIHMEYPFINDLPSEPVSWMFPYTEKEIMKYLVYKDLRKQGFWVVSGQDYGLPFLLYKGDPIMVHACMGVIVYASDIDTGLPPQKDSVPHYTRNAWPPGKKDAANLIDVSDDKQRNLEQIRTDRTTEESNDSDREKSKGARPNSNGIRKIPATPAEGQIEGKESIYCDPGLLVRTLIRAVRVTTFDKRALLIAYVQRRTGAVHYQTCRWNGHNFGGVTVPS